MLGNFKKMFIDKPNTNVNIPSGILESLAYNLPAGFSYTDVGKGFCVLKIPDGTQIKGRLRLEGASIENLKKCKNFDDLVSYAINIQKPIQLLPSEDGYYYIGDKPFRFEQFIKCPLKDLILKDGVIQYVPQKFEYELKMPMSVDEKKELVILKRVPFDSLKQLKFVSEENRGFVISVFVSVESPTMKINVATDFSNAGSVQNVCNSIFWFNSFANGKVKIFNELVNENNEADLTPYDNEAVDFWKQLLAIEKKFDVSFDVSNGVYERDVIIVEELYRSLVDNKPFRKDEMITNLTAYDENKTKASGTDGIIDPETTTTIHNKIHVNGVEVSVLNEMIQYYDKDGKLVTESIRDFTRKSILNEYSSLDEFINRWNSTDKKQAIIDELREQGVNLDLLRKDIGNDNIGDFDLILHIAYDKKPLTRKERAENVMKKGYLYKYSEVAQKVLRGLLEKYSDDNELELTNTKILELKPFDEYGSPMKIVKEFGGKEKYIEAVEELEDEIYAS